MARHPLPLLLFLFFLPPSLGCYTGSVEECLMTEFVPGHNLVGEGFDVVKLQTTGASVVEVQKYMVGGHEGKCTICKNHLLNKTQKLPVSVRDWRVKVLCNSLSSKMLESSQAVLKDTSESLGDSWRVGLGFSGTGDVPLAGTQSKSSKFARIHSKSDKFSFVSHEFKCQYYSFRLQAQPPPSKDLKAALLHLAYTPDHNDTSAFRHFISVYGTHFLRRVHLGGRVHSTTAIRTCKAALSGLDTRTVRDCLEVEASATIKGATVSPEAEYCELQSKKLKMTKSFGASFSDRFTEVQGGGREVGDLLFNPNGRQGYDKWLASLERVPGVVSYELSPLHYLVMDHPTLKSRLRAAIRDYIISSDVSLQCRARCSVGRQNQNCACHCSNHRMVNADCCPERPGVAQLSVTVVNGSALYGDVSTKTDGYVKVSYGPQGFQTRTINNDDFPRWNEQFNIGTVDLTNKTLLCFEVWDQDMMWSDGNLGKGADTPTRGLNVYKTFKLNHGTLTVKISAECGPSLQGTWCEQYAASPE